MVSLAIRRFQRLTYNIFFKRTSTYVAFVVAGAIGAEYAITTVVNNYWDDVNKGKQFKDIEPIFRERGLLKED